MVALLLTWKNLPRWPTEKLRAQIETCQRDGFVETVWEVFNKRASPGTPVFLLKQLPEPRGIFGFGRLLDSPSRRIDPEQSGEEGQEEKMRARVRLTCMTDALNGSFIVPLHELRAMRILTESQINARASGQMAIDDPDIERWLAERVERILRAATVATPSKDEVAPTTGPAPSDWSGTTGRTISASAWTYALQFGTRGLWKIGWTEDLRERLIEVNKHLPHEVLNESWRISLHQHWTDARRAYEMEQALLRSLDTHRTVGERVRCSQQILENAWTKVMAALAKQRSARG